jgi:hypothetical protein
MECHGIHELERELGMCVDELTMLGASLRGKLNFTDVLMAVDEQLIELTRQLEKSNRVFALMICTLVHETSQKFRNLDVGRVDHWSSVLRRVKLINNTFHILFIGAEGEVMKICVALRNATHIIKEDRFLAMRTEESRNTIMLIMLEKIGRTLSDLTGKDPKFYFFLGPAGELTMKKIIVILDP